MEIFDENSIEKLNFYLFSGKVVAKNRAFGNKIIFLQQFFFQLGLFEPPNPLRTPTAMPEFGVEAVDHNFFKSFRLMMTGIIVSKFYAQIFENI